MLLSQCYYRIPKTTKELQINHWFGYKSFDTERNPTHFPTNCGYNGSTTAARSLKEDICIFNVQIFGSAIEKHWAL